MQSIQVKIAFIRLAFILLPICLFAQDKQQQIDSFKNEIKQTQDLTEKLVLLDTLATISLYNGDQQQEEVFYFNEMLQLSKKLKNDKKQHQALKNLANYYLKKSNFKEAERFALESKQLCSTQQLKVERMFTYSLLGIIYNRFDNYDKAITNYKSALKLYNTELNLKEKKDYLNYLSTLYANLAIVYRNVQNDSLTDLYNLKSFKIAKKINDYMRMSQFYATQGWIYVIVENYEQAEHFFQKALQDSAKIRLKIYNIAAQHGLGFTYAKWGKHEQALHYNHLVLKYFKRTKNKSFSSSVSNILASVYLQTNDLQQATSYAEQALEIGEEIKSPKRIINAKLSLSDIYFKQQKPNKVRQVLASITSDSLLSNKLVWKQKTQIYARLSYLANKDKNYKKAFEYSKLHKQFKDSIHQRKLANFSDLATKHKYAEKRQELVIKEQELLLEQSKKKRVQGYLFLLSVFSLFLLVAFVYFYRQSAKNKAKLQHTLIDIKRIKAKIFEGEKLNKQQKTNLKHKEFRAFLMHKYHIDKNELLDVWESISNGVSRNQYASITEISENTIKSWRNELYAKLKKATFTTTRYSDYKAVVEYYNSLLAYENIFHFNKEQKNSPTWVKNTNMRL